MKPSSLLFELLKLHLLQASFCNLVGRQSHQADDRTGSSVCVTDDKRLVSVLHKQLLQTNQGKNHRPINNNNTRQNSSSRQIQQKQSTSFPQRHSYFPVAPEIDSKGDTTLHSVKTLKERRHNYEKGQWEFLLGLSRLRA